MFSRSILFFLVLAIASCKSTKQTNIHDYPVVMMERTTCLGGCPAYLVNIYPDGYATYEGKSNAPRQGLYQSTLTTEQLEGLKNSFVEANFFEFANVYSAMVSDLPTTYIYFNNGSNGHKITDYYGAPEELKALEKQFDEFIETLEWVKK